MVTRAGRRIPRRGRETKSYVGSKGRVWLSHPPFHSGSNSAKDAGHCGSTRDIFLLYHKLPQGTNADLSLRQRALPNSRGEGMEKCLSANRNLPRHAGSHPPMRSLFDFPRRLWYSLECAGREDGFAGHFGVCVVSICTACEREEPLSAVKHIASTRLSGRRRSGLLTRRANRLA